MSNKLPAQIAKAIADVKKSVFNENRSMSAYTDGVKNLARENDSGIVDVAGLADENSGAIIDLAGYIESIESELQQIRESLDSLEKYAKLLEQREINETTGNVWSIKDVPLEWRSKVETRIYSDGYYFDEDGTAYKANPT